MGKPTSPGPAPRRPVGIEGVSSFLAYTRALERWAQGAEAYMAGLQGEDLATAGGGDPVPVQLAMKMWERPD